MPFVAGSFSLYSPGNPVVTGTTISSTWANNTLTDIATGLSACLLKDGTQTITANLPMGGFIFTGLGNGSLSSDSAAFGQIATGAASAAQTALGAAADNVFRVVGSSDATKKLALEVDGLTASTTRTWTAQDRDLTVGISQLTRQTISSGTTIDFTGIPAGVRRIVITLSGLSTNGTDGWVLQLGDSGGIETSGYSCVGTTILSVAVASSLAPTTGFFLRGNTTASDAVSGNLTLNLQSTLADTWILTGILVDPGQLLVALSSGSKTTSATLDRIRITTSSGVNTFDSGFVNVSYEF